MIFLIDYFPHKLLNHALDRGGGIPKFLLKIINYKLQIYVN